MTQARKPAAWTSSLRRGGSRTPALAAGAAVLALVTLGPAGVTSARAGLPGGSPPPVIWKLPVRFAPVAATNFSPALAELTSPAFTPETALFWTGPSLGHSGDEISFEIAENLSRNKWFHSGVVESRGGGPALTTEPPSAAPFVTTTDVNDVIVTWADAASQQVSYAIGETGSGGRLTWSKGPGAIPGAFTSTGPTVFGLGVAVFVTWEARNSHRIDYVVGQVIHNAIRWGRIAQIPGARTDDPPTVTAAVVGHTARVYVFWRDSGAGGLLQGAWTTYPLPSGPAAWKAVSSSVTTGAAPAATAIDTETGFPILVVYRSATSSQLLYAQLFKTGPLTHESDWSVPKLRSELGPAVLPGVLAANDPDMVGLMTDDVRHCPAC
jgi:hypothetical protein